MRDTNETDKLLSDVARRAARYLDGLRTRRVAPDASALTALATLDEPLLRISVGMITQIGSV